MKRRMACTLVALLIAVGGCSRTRSELKPDETSRATASKHDWNDAEIDWWNYESGLKAAKETGKPVCLIFYTDWCPHCANYSHVFHDAAVVEKARQFVMVRVDGDKSRDLSKQYAPDGAYIPRTLFLSPEGTLDTTITARSGKYQYFYDEHSAAGILSGMDKAIAKYGR